MLDTILSRPFHRKRLGVRKIGGIPVGDLRIFGWRLLERAERASTKRRPRLHLRLSGSLAAAREQVAASAQTQQSQRKCWLSIRPEATPHDGPGGVPFPAPFVTATAF